MRFEDTDQELQALVALEVQWASSLLVLLVGQRRLSGGFCLSSLDILCGICGNESEGLVLA